MFPRRNFKSEQDWHRHYVYNDPEFIADMNAYKELEKLDSASPELAGLQQNIATQYAITVAEINRYLLGEILYSEYQTSTASFRMNLEKGEFTIQFGPSTSRAEVIEQWQKFEQMRVRLFPVRLSRRRVAEQPDLIYAIFKCRQRNLSFREIFTLYSTGAIPGYNGSISQYKDEDSLEKYYQANKPAP